MTDNEELKEMEAIPEEAVVDDFDIEVVAEDEGAPKGPKPIVPIGLAKEESTDAFETFRTQPTVWHDGQEKTMNLRRHIGLSMRPAVRQKLDDLIGQSYKDIRPVLDAMLESKEIEEVQTRRLAQTVPAEAEPGTVFIIINTDETVNSVHMG